MLGRGSTAAVFLGRDQALDVPVAIKALTGVGPLADATRFRREVRALVSLRHAHIVEVRDVGTCEGLPFLVLEYLAGGTLARRAAEAPLREGEIRELAISLLDALAHAHTTGVVHRDVKPENVLFTENGVPKLADFGLAQVAGSQKVTATGIVLGTPHFMAPEVLRGEPAVPASDVYSLAAMVWFLANGRPPHAGSPLEILEARRADPAPRGREGTDLRPFLAAAMRADPTRRPPVPSLRKLLVEGAAAVVDASHPTVQLSTEELQGARRKRSRPKPAKPLPRRHLLAGLGLVATALVVGLVSGPSPSAPPAAAPPPPPELDVRVVADRWGARADDLDLAKQVSDLLRIALKHGGEIRGHQLRQMQKVMDHGRALRAGASQPHEQLDAIVANLRAALPGIPLRDEVRQEREELVAALTSRDAPFEDRWKLYAALTRLRRLDAWVEAWGLPPPYDLGPLLALVVPHGQGPAPPELQERPLEVLPPPPEGPDPGPGPHRVFHWEHEWDRQMPLLRGPVHPDEATRIIRLGNMVLTAGSKGRWREEDHYRVESHLSLGADVRERYERAILRFGTANMVPPLHMVVDMNRRRIRIHAPPDRHGKSWWAFERLPRYLVTVELPIELLRDGENLFVFQSDYAPGMQCIHGLEFGWCTLELVERKNP